MQHGHTSSDKTTARERETNPAQRSTDSAEKTQPLIVISERHAADLRPTARSQMSVSFEVSGGGGGEGLVHRLLSLMLQIGAVSTWLHVTRGWSRKTSPQKCAVPLITSMASDGGGYDVTSLSDSFRFERACAAQRQVATPREGTSSLASGSAHKHQHRSPTCVLPFVSNLSVESQEKMSLKLWRRQTGLHQRLSANSVFNRATPLSASQVKAAVE